MRIHEIEIHMGIRAVKILEQVCAVVLAAGDGKRMRSARPKVLCEVLFRPMICWIADTLEKCGIGEVCAVFGSGAGSDSPLCLGGAERTAGHRPCSHAGESFFTGASRR